MAVIDEVRFEPESDIRFEPDAEPIRFEADNRTDWTTERERIESERGPRPIAEDISVVPATLQELLQKPSPVAQSKELTVSGVLKGGLETLMTPIVEFPAVPGALMQGVLNPLLPGDSVAKIAEGAGRFVSKAASSITAPGMVGILGLSAVAPPAGAAIIAGLGAHGIGPAAVEAVEASKRGDLAGFTESTLDTAMAGVMAGGGARGVIGGRRLPRAAAAIETLAGRKPPVLPVEAAVEAAVARPAEAVATPEPAAEAVPVTPEVPKPSESLVAKIKTVEIPLDQLSISMDLPQFKGGANAKGIVRPLGGTFDPTGVGPIQVWRRLDGRLEVISGRHRFDLAQRSGDKTIAAQVHDESAGFLLRDAARLDAILNIRDGQGSIGDFAKFFRYTDPPITEAAAKSEGLLADAKGKAGFTIGTAAGEDLFALHQAERIADAQASAIASIAPGDPALQAVGIRLALDGKSAEATGDIMRLAKQRANAKAAEGDQGDLFGFDDSAIREMEAQSALASRERSLIRAQINAVKGAAKKPELAKSMGIDVADPAGILKKVAELEARLTLLKDHPEVAGQLPSAEVAPAAPVEPTPTLRSGEKGTGELFQGKDQPFNLAGETTVDGGRIATEASQAEATRIEAARIAAEQQGEIFGMGGAVPGEFTAGQGQPTAMKFRQIDMERQKRGLPPIPKPEGTKDQIVWDRALAEIDKDPTLPDRLIAELDKQPRAIEDWENHVLLLRKIDLKNEYAKATRDLAQAFDDGRMDDVAAIRPRVQVWSNQLTQLEIVSRQAGSARGRALRALQVMANEDFSLAQLEMNKRADVGGRPLTDAERTDLVRINRELEATQKAFETRVADLESKLSSAEAQAALAQAKASVAAEPTYPRPVIEAAERIVQGWEKRGEAAAERLRKKLGQLGTTPDPTILIDLAEIGIAKFGRGALDFAKWSEAMLKDFGPKIEPFLRDAYDAAQKLLEVETNKITGPLSDQVKRRIKKTDVAEKITDAKERIGSKIAEGDDANVTPNVRKLVRALVEQDPNISRETLVDAVHDVLREFQPDISRLEAMDAISGRGKFWLPPQDAVSKTVRDLSTQIRLVAHQQDVVAGRPLPRTGYQPEPLTDAARAESQKLNELKRQYGVVVTDPASQLASTLAARKTYYRHRIADLQQEIAAGERTVKTRSSSPTDPQLEAMRAELAKLKEEHEAIFGKAEKTPEQRVAAAMSAVERSITDLEARINSGDIGPRSRESKTPNTPELEAARARRDALKEELQELRDIANPKKTPEERALQSLKTRLTNRVAELREKLASGDFSARAKRPPLDLSKDTEAMRLKAEHETVKREYEQARIRDQAKNMTGMQKTWANIKETINLYRNYITAFDLSAVLRQGGPFTLGHPIKATRSIGAMLRAFANEKAALTGEQRILHRPNAALYARDKLYLPQINEARLSAQEEMIMSRLAPRIPGIKASNRAFITFLNRVRADHYDAMAEGWAFTKGAPTPAEGRIIAQAVNTASGRGSLGKFEPAGELLSTVLFSPRLLVSRFQILTGQPFYGGNARTRKAIATEYARTLAGVGAAYGLATLAGAEIETDVRSSDFGKFKWGNTRLDPLMGLAQVTVLVSRLTTGETKGLRTGRITDLRADRPKFGQADSAEVIGRFLRTKIAPALGLGLDVITGSNVVGEPVTPGSVAKDILVPISYGDILAVMEEQGIPRGTALELLNLLGMSLQHFDETKKNR